MGYDGSLKFDTEIDESGFNKGTSKLSSIMQTGLGYLTGSLMKDALSKLGDISTSVVRIGSDFESQMSRVKAISGATGEEFQKLRDLAIQLGSDTAFSSSEAAQGMENLAAAGFETNEIMDAMPGLLNLAAASGEDLASSSDIAASTLRGFGLAAGDAAHVADVLAENANRTNSSVRDTGEAMKYIAPLAKASGISLEETAAAIGLMANAGIQGSQAGTTLRGALSRLSKPTEDMAIAMDELGISFYDSNGKMKSLADQVSMLQDAMKDMTDEEKNYYLTTLYGQEALSGMMALINEGGDSLRSLSEDYKNCAGSAEEAAEIMMDNFAGSVEQLSGSLESLGIQIFDSVSTPLKNLADMATETVNQMTSAFQSGGPIAALQALFSSLTENISAYVPQLLENGYQMILQFSQGFAQGFPEALSKFLEFLQGIGNKIAEYAPIFIQKGFEILSNLATGIANAIPVLIEKVPTIITTFANIINDNFPIILAKGAEIIGQLALGLIQAIPTLIANVPKIVEAIGSAILAYQWWNLGQTIIGFFKDGILSMVGAVGKAGGSVLNAIKGALQNLPSTLSSIGKSAMNGLGSAIRGAIGTVRSAASSIGNAIVSALKSIPSRMLSIGRNIVQGLWNGISDMTGWIISKIGGFADSVVSRMCDFFGINSPSTVMRDEVGQWLAKGIGVGFEENLPTKQMTSSMSDAISKMKMGAMSITSKPVTTSSYQPGYYTKDTNNDIINEVAGLLLKIADRPIESNFYVGKEKMAKAIVKPLTEEQERKNKIINRLGGVR